ncbi:MAG: hypothetical protein LBD73_06590 [Deferribacteraceae bacterium]|jgi:hypothetical protein|nr:hypothetical protein [Deferribacteraceae bacterium]
MPIVKYQKRIDVPHIDYYPLFVDYDMETARPRGGSTCIDFFSVGKLAKLVDSCGKSDILYVQKDKIHPSDGFFITDFSKIKTNPVWFRQVLDGMGITEFYIENSKTFPFNEREKLFENFKVTLVNFAE